MGLETILLGTLAAGTAVKAFGEARAGTQAQAAAEAQAREIQREGGEQARLFRRSARREIGEQAAGYARAGVRVGEGSPLLLLMESADEMERALAEIHRGSSAEAELTRFRGREARTAGFIQAGGTILGGATEFGLTARRFKQTSNPGPGVTFPQGRDRFEELDRQFRAFRLF